MPQHTHDGQQNTISEDEASHLDHNELHGHQLIELFESDLPWNAVIERLLKSLYNVFEILQFDSPLLADYYYKIMLTRTKRQYRLLLKYIFYLTLVFFFEAGVRDPSTGLVSPYRIAAYNLPLIMLYAITLSNPPHKTYVQLSFAICLSIPIVIFWSRGLIIHQHHGLHSVGIILFLGMFVLLPVRMALCCSIAVMFTITDVSLQVYHASGIFANVDYQADKPWMRFDLFRRMRYGNRTYALTDPLLIVRDHVISWIPVILIAMYLRFWNTIRRRIAFYKLGKSVQARHDCESALNGQVRWIEAVMPSVVREEYQALRQSNRHLGAGKWIFNKTFDNVSILFADIVGFTRMSSNKTAHQVVTLLNNLFNRFDELCEATHCEKIGTLGDCYYCVSGCPVPRSNHAVCCIEMGLGMCRVIKVFNCDFHESVGMRIGIHTGRVNAAIIGSQRFRFDVYSYDVIIASALESSGRPGRVHISDRTFELVKTMYNFSQGEPLAIKQEDMFGIAGMTLVTKYINTYFVDPRSSLWRQKHEKFGKSQTNLRSVSDNRSTIRDPVLDSTLEQIVYRTAVLRPNQGEDGEDVEKKTRRRNQKKFGGQNEEEQRTEPDAQKEQQQQREDEQGEKANEEAKEAKEEEEDEEEEEEEEETTHTSWTRTDRLKDEDPNSAMRAFERDVQLINNLQNDPEQQHTLFRRLPVSPALMTFRDRETEWHYHTHVLDSTRRIYVDSQKVAPIPDVIMCLMVLSSVLLCCLLVQSSYSIMESRFYPLCTGILLIYIGVSVCLIFVSTTHEDRIRSARVRRAYRILIHPVSRELCTAIMTMMPTVILRLFIHLCNSNAVLVGKRRLLTALSFHCMLIHCVPTSSLAWTRYICAGITYLIVLEGSRCTRYTAPKENKCLDLARFSHGFAYGNFCAVFMIEWILCTVLVILMSRENERNCRRCFYVSREAEIAVDAAEMAVAEARDLLYNIIPKYVHDQLKSYRTSSSSSSKTSFSYAVSIAHAGVAFATISNFFAKYYREDYKGGENALKLLNSIMCMFEELLDLPEMKDVEKVKTINDCYMIAAGLNRDEVNRNESDKAHLVALMDYCHLIIDALDKFNNMYIIGTDQFQIKIGYNTGPLIAGVIGTTKPMYDIWGNTVNVASRMYSTGLVGRIQVPKDVAEELEQYYKFTYRGEVFVKGKGDMRTYLCDRKS